MNGFKTKIGRLRYKLAGVTAGISTAIMMSPVTASAAGTWSSDEAQKNGGVAASSMIKEIIKWVGGAFSIVGALFAFMGVWKVIQAFRNDNNPEAISSGAKDIVVGGLMIALGLIAGSNMFNKMIGLSK